MNRINYLGIGADGEQVKLERVHNACWFVHCEGNTQSPFEFINEKNARQFVDFLVMERIGEL